jgi:hypothetical protein
VSGDIAWVKGEREDTVSGNLPLGVNYNLPWWELATKIDGREARQISKKEGIY